MRCENLTARRGNTRTALIAGVVLVAAIGWIGYYWFGRSTSMPPDHGRGLAEPFLAEIRNDHVDAAWESTSAEFKSAMGKESFRRYVREHPILKAPLELANFQTVSLRNTPCIECAFRKQAEPGSRVRVRVLIAQERGHWKVERLVAE